MRRFFALFAALAISITGLTASPAQASVADGIYQCTSGSFTITSGVVSNGGGGSGNCTGHANIPNGVTAIGDSAFYQSGLATVSMPNTVTSIGDSAFRHMPNMTTVTIPSSVQTIGFLAFGTTYLTSITFASPSSLTTIGDYAFQSTRFTSVTIPASVTSFSSTAFQLNTDLTNVSFLGAEPAGRPWSAPSSITVSPAYTCTTGSFAVVNNVVTNGSTCTGTANIPSGVTAIGAGAFQNSAVTEITLPAGVAEIRDYAFYYATSLSSINLPSSVTSIGLGAFINTTSLASLTLPANLTSLGNQAFWSSGLTSVSIPSGITTIGDEVFLGAASLASVTLPSTLTSIGTKAFKNATSLSSITLPNSLTTIGTEAFQSNTGLTAITIPSSVTSIGSLAFNGTRLVSLTIPSSVTSIANNVFQGITTLTTISLPSTLTSIGDGAFYDATALTSVTIPSGVSSIGAYAFGNNTALTSVSLPSTLTSIGSGAFRNATSLSSITLPPNLTSIGEDAFRESALNSVVVPGSLTQMGDCAFCVTPNLTSVVIQSGSLTNLGQYTFASTPLLNSVSLPNNILVLGAGVFRNAIDYSPYQSRLTSITLPSNLTTIGGNAFEGQNALTNLNIPASVSDIASLAFVGATSLLDVTFDGIVAPTAPSNAFFGVGTGAKASIRANATGFGQSGGLWNGLVIDPITVETYSCSTGLASNSTPNFTITNGVVSQGQTCSGAVVIPSQATAIGANAFSNGTLITSIAIPATVTTINSSAFSGASSLVTIVVNASNADYSSVGGVLFNKAGTTLIKYPAGKTATSYTLGILITEIAAGAFSGSSTLAGVNFEGNAPATVGVDAFSGLAAGAKALVDPSATGFGTMGSTWNALTVASNVIAPPVTSSPFQQPPMRPLPKVSGVQIQRGIGAKSSTVKLQLTGVEQGQSGQDIQIKIFDVKGNLFKVLTVPINGVAGSLEVALPLPLGEFTVEANTIGAAGLATELVKATSPIVQKSFYASGSSNKSPVLFGKAFARPVAFAANSSVLTARERKALLLVAAELRKTRSSLAITGFSASSGASRSFDRNLSNSRALSVARFLKAQGLSNILYVAGYGSISNARSADSSRKVELRIIN